MVEMTRMTEKEKKALVINMEGNRLAVAGDSVGARNKYMEALLLDPTNSIIEKNLMGAITDHHRLEYGDQEINVTLTPEQKADLIIWLNVTLRDPNLKQNYASRLHDLYVQLTGTKHDVWDEFGGIYHPEVDSVAAQ